MPQQSLFQETTPGVIDMTKGKIAFDCISEPYSQFGNISGQGIQKILGTPKHSRLQTLIRETVQNAWDARIDSDFDLRYRIELKTLDKDQLKFLKSTVLKSKTNSKPYEGLLKSHLASKEVDLLTVSDFGTSGLDGPVRSDVATKKDEPTNFVDFVRNIGSPRDQEMGGGTYGYGKSSVYNLSKTESIMIYSACQYKGRMDHRFLMSGLSDPFEFKNLKYTGRHWWGRNEDDFVLPLENDESIATADIFGFADRRNEGTGTTLGVLFPNLDGFERKDIGKSIVSSLLWYFWPKIVNTDNQIIFEVAVDGKEIEIPDVHATPPFSTFAKAYEQLDDKDLSKAITSQRPRKTLGRLSIATNPVMDRADGLENDEVPGKTHHIALMRPAELVVKYLEGPEIPSDMVEYAGLFRCDEAVEQAFAAAEPPAHDDWISEYLSDRIDRTCVNVAMREIRNELREFVDSKTMQPQMTRESLSLGKLSDRLGALLIGQVGTRLGKNPASGQAKKSKTKKKKGKTGTSRKPALLVEFDSFAKVKKTDSAVFRISAITDVEDVFTVRVEPKVQLDDGGTTNSPEGVEPPEIVEWRDDRNKSLGEGPECSVDFGKCDYVTVAVSQPMHCAVALEAKVD